MSGQPLKIFNASAGSGKTYTLVQEYLRIVLHNSNPYKFKHILAMTFTNKAANEMKGRILEGLIQLAKPENEKNAKELDFLNATSKNLKISPALIEKRAAEIQNNILHNYGAFSVMTIDKFTHKIIRTFAKDLNLSIDFDVELDVKKLRKQITDMLFDQIGRNKDLTRLMLYYAKSNLEADKSWNFSKQLYEFSNEIFKESAIDAIERIKEFSPEDFIRIREDLVKENQQFIATLKRNAQEASDLISSRGLEADDFHGKTRSIQAYFKRTAGGKKEMPSDTLQKYVRDGKWGHSQSVNKETVEEIAPLLEQYFNQIMEWFESDFKTYNINYEILKNLNNLSLLNHLSSILEKIKADNNVLLISDFYKKIADIIVKEPVPFIYERLGVRYHHFLLDEFQDTSQLQWMNLIPLVHNSLAFEYENLIVGDGKQAIYRWRNGEVEQFTRLPEEVYNPEKIASLAEAEPLFKALGEKHTLKANYRSAPEIVAFNNELFKSISEKLPEGIQRIYNSVYQESEKSFKGYIETLFHQDFDEAEQLNYVLNIVERSLQKGYRLSDICIVVRRNKEGSKIARFLTEKRYKIISPDSLFIGKDISVKLVVSIIGSLLNPTNRNFKIKSLEHFAATHSTLGIRELINRFEGNLNSLSIIDIFKNFEVELKDPIHFHNLYEFVEHISEAFQLDMNGNPFLQFLMEQVHLFEKRNNSNARDFIDWYFEHGKETSIISPEGAEAIQVMTIHKSKGLQFPIVICPFFDWSFQLNRQIAWVEDDKRELPVYFVKMVNAIKESELEPYYNEESFKYLMDQLNMIYVAFTRPEVALFTCGKAVSKTSKSDHLSKWIMSFLEDTELGSFEGDLYTYGSFDSRPDVAESAVAYLYDATFFTRKMDKPTLSFKSSANWDIQETIAEGLDERRLFGTKVHLTLALMKSENELETAVEKLLKKGKIDQNESDLIKATIADLFKNERFKFYFTHPKQLNEKEIISAEGQLLIPDKIVITPKETIIVDFKTGQMTPAHKKQVGSYIKIMQDLGYESVKGELFYTESREVIEVGG